MAKRDLTELAVHRVGETGDLVLGATEQAEGDNFGQHQRSEERGLVGVIARHPLNDALRDRTGGRLLSWALLQHSECDPSTSLSREAIGQP